MTYRFLVSPGFSFWKSAREWRVRLVLLSVFLAGFLHTSAQDAQFTQFYADPLYLAPSFAGSTDGSRAVLHFRDQWLQVPGSFITYALSYDHYFPNLKSGGGIIFYRDQAGSGKLSTTNFSLQYSYNISVNRYWQVRPGISLSYIQRGLRFDKLIFGDQLSFTGNASSTVEIPTDKKVGYIDFSASALSYSEKYWFGVNVDHLSRPNQSLQNGESRLPVRYTVFGGGKMFLRKKLGDYDEESLSLAFLYKAQQKYDQIDIGLYWTKRPLVIGFWYRGIPVVKQYDKGYSNNDAAMILIGYKRENFRVGYSYDFTVSRLVSRTGGAHEISVIYEFLQDQVQKKKKKHVVVSCPKF